MSELTEALPPGLDEAVARRRATAAQEQVVQRLWARDDTLWGPEGQAEVADRLGWLDVLDESHRGLERLVALREACVADGITDAVLLGMGGSSLAPEVLRRTSGIADGALRLHLLDSTDAQAVRDVEAEVDLAKTLFVVSSKSGGTIETLTQFAYFHAKQPLGEHYVAVTDPGSPLEQLAEEHGFREVFRNDPEIGGRYSALSYFGLVPAALIGVDLAALLERADDARMAAKAEDVEANPGVALGCALGELALQGRDKLTWVVDEPFGSFGLWVEQLVAESTGKHGKGILPVADEPLGAVGDYGHDRVFVDVSAGTGPEDEHDAALGALAEAGHPVLTLRVSAEPGELGRLFYVAEVATAVAGWALGINPFDQPDVQSAKDATNAVLADGVPDGLAVEPARAVGELVAGGPPLYVAVMGYVPPSEAVDEAVVELRLALRERLGVATTYGYGPRFLHSTGQLHKGGPPHGRFLQLVARHEEDLPVSGAKVPSFETLKRAQAAGDLRTLQDKGLPAWQVEITGDVAAAVRDLARLVREV